MTGLASCIGLNTCPIQMNTGGSPEGIHQRIKSLINENLQDMKRSPFYSFIIVMGVFALLLCSCQFSYGSSNESEASDGEGDNICEMCEGTGREECPYCSGRGYESCKYCNGTRYYFGEYCHFCNRTGRKECNNCSGRGYNDCLTCRGTGRVEW